MTSTQLKSTMMDALDDARAGFVTYIVRNGRRVAALVPVGVGQAFEEQAPLPDHARARAEIAPLARAQTEITATLDRLAGTVHGHPTGTAGAEPVPAPVPDARPVSPESSLADGLRESDESTFGGGW
ncbi:MULTISPECIES: hypothetical protein [Actinosynnema]|uniref:hypothetical protein n=1 Tax=Actinosynnema TaxID=40566 RepID=UPI0020A23E61|nr:hypothetical protein [Actinosynnema pretiosum]